MTRVNRHVVQRSFDFVVLQPPIFVFPWLLMWGWKKVRMKFAAEKIIHATVVSQGWYYAFHVVNFVTL